MKNSVPLIAHVIHRLEVGGLENGLVNLINHIPEDRYRHAILCMKGYSDFSARIRRKDVLLIDLEKREGQDFMLYHRLWKHFTELKPDIVHTRNLAALEAVVPAMLTGVKRRIHSEHGRDFNDMEGNNRKHLLLRRAFLPATSHAIALSRDLEDYLHEKIGVPRRKITQIYNGVDTEKFHPSEGKNPALPFADPELVVFGTAGRMQPVKDQTNLVRAFIRMLEIAPQFRDRARLMMIGEGPLRNEAISLLEEAGCSGLSWLPGSRDDVADIMGQMDVFVLPSLSEGISNTILEAMATGLPVIATRVGGNAELVDENGTGLLVPPADSEALARAMIRYLENPRMIARHGSSARQKAEQSFSMDAMVSAYLQVYDGKGRKR